MGQTRWESHAGDPLLLVCVTTTTALVKILQVEKDYNQNDIKFFIELNLFILYLENATWGAGC